MKKLLALALSLILCAGLIPMSVSADGIAIGDSIHGWNDWVINVENPAYMSATLAVDPEDESETNKVIKIERTGLYTNQTDTPLVVSERPRKRLLENGLPMELTGDVMLSVRLNAAEAGQSSFTLAARVWNQGGEGDTLAQAFFDVNGILKNERQAGSTSVSTLPLYPTNTWFTFGMYLHTGTNTWDSYVDGVKVNSAPLDFFPTTAPPTEMKLSQVHLDVRRASAGLGIWYADDLEISRYVYDKSSVTPYNSNKWNRLIDDNLNSLQGTLVKGTPINDWYLFDGRNTTTNPESGATTSFVADPIGGASNTVMKIDRTRMGDTLANGTSGNERPYKAIMRNGGLKVVTDDIKLGANIYAGEAGLSSLTFGLKDNNSSTSLTTQEGITAAHVFLGGLDNTGNVRNEYRETALSGSTSMSNVYPGDKKTVFPSDRWFRLEMVFHAKLRTYDVYIDGEKINTEPIRFYDVKERQDRNSDSLSRISIDVRRWSDGAGTWYIDDLTLDVYSELNEKYWSDFVDETFEEAEIDTAISNNSPDNFVDLPALNSGNSINNWKEFTGGDGITNRFVKNGGNTVLEMNRTAFSASNKRPQKQLLKPNSTEFIEIKNKAVISMSLNAAESGTGTFTIGAKDGSGSSTGNNEGKFLAQAYFDGSATGNAQRLRNEHPTSSGGSVNIDAKAFPKSGWFEFTMVIDMNNETWDTYVDGIKLNETPQIYYYTDADTEGNHPDNNGKTLSRIVPDIKRGEIKNNPLAAPIKWEIDNFKIKTYNIFSDTENWITLLKDDLDGDEFFHVEGLVGDNTSVTGVSIKKLKNYADDATVLVAVYNSDHSLSNLSYATVDKNNDQGDSWNIIINEIPLITDQYVKVFVWSALDELSPMMKVYPNN